MSSESGLRVVQVVSTNRHAGVENYVGRLAGELASRGHRVTVITRFPSDAFVPESVAAVNVRHWREAAEVLRSMSLVDVVHTHMTEADTAAAWALRKRSTLLVSTRHFATQRWSTEDGQGSKMLRIPFVPAPLHPRRLMNAVHDRIDARIDVELAISDFVASRMGRCEGIVRSGVDVQDQVPSVEDRGQRVVVLQRLEPVKSTVVALRAWAKSSARHRGWTLEIHGEGSERERLVDEVRRHGLEGSVTLPGRCNDVASLLRSSSLLVAPACSEPLGLTVLEAMSFGVPVIAAASGGHLETVGRVAGAALFGEEDAESCAAELDRLTSDAAERHRLSDAQRDLQKSDFSLESMADHLERIYRSRIERA